MKRTSLARMRDLDFSRKLLETAKSNSLCGLPMTREAIIEAALKRRPDSFYTSTSNACKVLRRISGSDYIRNRILHANPVRQQFWIDLHDKVWRYCVRNPSTSFDDAVAHILCFSKPDRFYISDSKALKLFADTFTSEPSYVPR